MLGRRKVGKTRTLLEDEAYTAGNTARGGKKGKEKVEIR